MYDVYTATPEDFAKAEDQSNIIAGALVQFMIGNWPVKALQKLPAAIQETEFVNQMIRRTINNIDDAVFKAAMGKSM